MTREEAAKLVTLLVKGFPDTKADAGTVAVYVDMLVDLDFQAARNGIARLLTTARYFPRIAEIREAACSAAGKQLRSGADAWLDVVEQIRKEGWCGRPKFADLIVAEIVRRWGWVAICKEGDDTADRARFIEMYNALAKTRWSDELVGKRLVESTMPARMLEGIGIGGAK